LISIENVIGTTAGSDQIFGNELANRLDGRGGNDTLDGGFGSDVLIGGAGIDTASYLSHDANNVPIVGPDIISLGLDTADGSYTRLGAAGVSGGVIQTVIVETDVLRGIENITGSNRPEVITGNDFDNTLDGRGGNDTMDGGLGNDVIIGGNPLFIVGGGVIPRYGELRESRRGHGRFRTGYHPARAERCRRQLYASRTCTSSCLDRDRRNGRVAGARKRDRLKPFRNDQRQ